MRDDIKLMLRVIGEALALGAMAALCFTAMVLW